jgi:predicted ABC-type ATPase
MGNGNPYKKINIVAGPNGSGKTTFARSFLGRDPPELVLSKSDYEAWDLKNQTQFATRFLKGQVHDRKRKTK